VACPAVAGRRLNPDALERCVTQDLAVSDTVQTTASGKDYVVTLGLPMDMVEHLEEDLLVD